MQGLLLWGTGSPAEGAGGVTAGPGVGDEMGQTCELQRESSDARTVLFIKARGALVELSHLDASVCHILSNSPMRKALARVHFTDGGAVARRG